MLDSFITAQILHSDSSFTMYQCLENSCVIICSPAKRKEAKRERGGGRTIAGQEWKDGVIKIYREIKVDRDGGGAHIERETRRDQRIMRGEG